MYQNRAQQGKEIVPRSPDTLPARLGQCSMGLNATISMASSIREKLFGAVPEAMPDNSNAIEPNHVSYQIEMLQARISELESILGAINSNL